MASLNKVMIIGNCTRDPEIRYTPKGTALTELGLAVNRRYTDPSSGERREETTFVDVQLWGRTAEVACEYLRKGKPVYIEGRLQLDSWDDKQTGQKRHKLKVIGEELQLLGSRDDGGRQESQAPHERQQRPAQRPPQRPPSSMPKPPADPALDPEDNDDIPF